MRRPPQYAQPPKSWPLTFWPWKWCPSHVDYLYANFSLPGPLCSRLRPDVRDRQTDVRRASSLNAPCPIDVKNVFLHFFIHGTFLTFFILLMFLIFKNVHWKYHLKSLSKQRKQIGSVWLFFFVPMLEFPYRPIYWQALLGGIMSITSVFTIGPFVPCTILAKS